MTALSNYSKDHRNQSQQPVRASRIRYYDPKYLHEVTIRTNNGAFSFDPNNQDLNSKIVGLLFLASALYGIKIVALHFMTNHYHGLFEIPSSGNFCKFLMHFHGGLARLAHDALGTKGKFWSENKWVAVAQDEVSVARRIRYILGQAVKPGLVEHPIQFPGVSSAAAMVDGKPLLGKVIDLTKRYRDAQLKAGAGPLTSYVRIVEVAISPPRCWAHLSRGELQLRYRAIADEAAHTLLHVLRKTKLLAQPKDSAVTADLAQCYAPNSDGLFCDSPGDTVVIPQRESESGRPFEQGPPGAKKRPGKRSRMPYLLSANQDEVAEYERQYLAVCDAYAAAKQHWRARARTGAGGLTGPRFRLPQHTLVGTMPLLD